MPRRNRNAGEREYAPLDLAKLKDSLAIDWKRRQRDRAARESN